MCPLGLGACLRSYDSYLSYEERPKKCFVFFSELLCSVFISKHIIYWCKGLWVLSFSLPVTISSDSLTCKIVTYHTNKAQQQNLGMVKVHTHEARPGQTKGWFKCIWGLGVGCGTAPTKHTSEKSPLKSHGYFYVMAHVVLRTTWSPATSQVSFVYWRPQDKQLASHSLVPQCLVSPHAQSNRVNQWPKTTETLSRH